MLLCLAAGAGALDLVAREVGYVIKRVEGPVLVGIHSGDPLYEQRPIEEALVGQPVVLRRLRLVNEPRAVFEDELRRAGLPCGVLLQVYDRERYGISLAGDCSHGAAASEEAVPLWGIEPDSTRTARRWNETVQEREERLAAQRAAAASPEGLLEAQRERERRRARWRLRLARMAGIPVSIQGDVPAFHLDVDERSCYEPHRMPQDWGVSLGIGLAEASVERGFFLVSAFQLRQTRWAPDGGYWYPYLATRYTVESAFAWRWVPKRWRGERAAQPFLEAAWGVAFNREKSPRNPRYSGRHNFAPVIATALGLQLANERFGLQVGAQLLASAWFPIRIDAVDYNGVACYPSGTWTTTGIRGAIFLGFLLP